VDLVKQFAAQRTEQNAFAQDLLNIRTSGCVTVSQLVSNPVLAFQKTQADFGQSWRQFADHALRILYLIALLITLIPGAGRMRNEGCDVCYQVE
jgi:predicted membrane protein